MTQKGEISNGVDLYNRRKEKDNEKVNFNFYAFNCCYYK